RRKRAPSSCIGDHLLAVDRLWNRRFDPMNRALPPAGGWFAWVPLGPLRSPPSSYYLGPVCGGGPASCSSGPPKFQKVHIFVWGFGKIDSPPPNRWRELHATADLVATKDFRSRASREGLFTTTK